MKRFEKWILFAAVFEIAFLAGNLVGCDDTPECTGSQCVDGGGDTAPPQQDGSTDSDGTVNPTDGGDGGGVCALYEPLDGWQSGWSCNKGSVPMNCTFTLANLSGACYFSCSDSQAGDDFKCPPPASFSHSASFSVFTCTSTSQDLVSCTR